MTRIVGELFSADGPLDGHLYVKAGGSFIGAPSKELSFRVKQGIVDIELPPCPAGMPYFVDWKNLGDLTKLQYIERWRVPAIDEVTIDEVRGLSRSGTIRKRRPEGKTDILEATMLRSEVNQLNEAVSALEHENSRLLKALTEAENKASSAQARVASLMAEAQKVARISYEASQKPIEKIVEKVIERTITPDEYVEAIAAYKEQIAILDQEKEALKQELDATFSLKTHFAGLHSEIDRLKNEKQRLLARIEELKQPQRTASSFRNEAIANLDRLTGG